VLLELRLLLPTSTAGFISLTGILNGLSAQLHSG
jgi:hypothetical protein